MGVCSSKQDVDGENADGEVEVTAKTQRRKLSVAPQHEGGGGIDEANKGNRKASIVEGLGELSDLEMKGKGDLEIASKSNKGFVPYSKKKVNQDRPVVKFSLQDDPSLNLFGVMDGHGEHGHKVAQFIMDRLPICLAKQDLKGDTEKAIFDGVKKVVSNLKTQSNINCAFSGTTCVFAVQKDKRLYVANLGDSRCVLARQEGSGAKAIDLSDDQKPENPLEKARIIKAGGRVEPLPGPPGEDCGPPRVWLKEVDVPGLAMSRSIGDDVSQTVGVLSIPEIKQHELQDNDILAIWASDGVWEFISSQEAIDLVWKNHDNLKKAVDELCSEATRRWKAEEEVIDDITAVIVKFNKVK